MVEGLYYTADEYRITMTNGELVIYFIWTFLLNQNHPRRSNSFSGVEVIKIEFKNNIVKPLGKVNRSFLYLRSIYYKNHILSLICKITFNVTKKYIKKISARVHDVHLALETI